MKFLVSEKPIEEERRFGVDGANPGRTKGEREGLSP